jgi:Rod binding domain-containing protein
MSSLDPGLQLPPVDPAAIPADVRAAGPEARQLYAVALGFERMLLEELTSELAEASPVGDDEDSEGFGAVSGMLREQLPGILADALTAGGGIGLAPELYRNLKADEPDR